MIGDYLMKALQGYQFLCYCNIILGIHEDKILSYNASGRALLEEWKIKLYIERNESLRRLKNFQETKANNECVGRNYLLYHQFTTGERKKVRAGKILYVVHAYLARIWFGVNWHTCMHVEEICGMFIQIPGYLWHDRTDVRIFPDGKIFTSRMPYINTVRYYWRKICEDGQFILYVTFITLIYLKDQQ